MAESRKAESNNDESSIDFSERSKNNFIFGIDLGLLSLGIANVEAFHIDFADKRRIMQGGADSFLTFPLNARVGYVRNIGNWSIGINALYNITYALFSDDMLDILSSSSWELSGMSYSQRGDIKVNTYALLQRVGGEFVVLYQNQDPKLLKVFGDTSIYIGISVYGDIGSKLHGQIRQTHENGVYKADFTREINGLYMGLKAGLVWYFHKNMGMTYEINISFPIKGEDNISTTLNWAVFGLQWRI